MALTDELNSCTLPEGYPTGLKLVSRPQSFCEEVSLSKTLSVEGSSTLNSIQSLVVPKIYYVYRTLR